jgi:hypothetical protein
VRVDAAPDLGIGVEIECAWIGEIAGMNFDLDLDLDVDLDPWMLQQGHERNNCYCLS